MKKVLWLIVCLMTMVVNLTSCNDFESEAKSNMEKHMKDIAKNSKTLEISNIETVFNADSCVALKFKASGQNGFGGYSKHEYVYLYSVYNFNELGIKKIYALLNIDEELGATLWLQLKKDMEIKPCDSIKNQIIALSVLCGFDVENDERVLNYMVK